MTAKWWMSGLDGVGEVGAAPGRVITGHQKHGVRIQDQELLDAVEEEGACHLVALVTSDKIDHYHKYKINNSRHRKAHL